MRRLRRGLSRLAGLACLVAGAATAQDFPVDPVGSSRPPPLGAPAARLTTPDSAQTLIELVTPLQILDRLVVPGTRLQLEWRPAGGISSGEIPSPVIVAHGAKPGPVLCLTAGIHGDEINGIEIVRRIAHGIDATRLSGTVIAVPIVNVFGYSRGTRYLPDRRDLNRNFPGSPRGSIASRIAHAFFEDIVRHCDKLVDFHTGSFDRDNLPQVRADLTDGNVLEFTRAFGATVVLHSPGNKGMLRDAATAAGIPAVAFEVGAPTRLQLPEILVASAVVRGAMHTLGLLDQDAPGEGRGPQPTYFDSRWVRANAGGLLMAEVKLGERVQAGQRLGRIVDPVANVERYLLAPLTGRVIGLAQNQLVLPGFAAFHLGRETSEQQAVEEAEIGPRTEVVPEDPAARADDDPEEGDG